MKQIKTPHGTFAIYINRVTVDSREFHHLSFVDKENRVQIVLMQHAEGQWSFANEFQLPEWITSMRTWFITLIMQEEAVEA